ncbi:MAG: LysE family transporter [Rikenellaceae bacterium]
MVLNIIEAFGRSMMVGVAASITVGPVAVLCIQRTLSKSRRSGLISGLGVACADTLMAIAAYFCYAVLQHQLELYDVLLRVIGGIFVVGVGVFIFVQNPVTQIKKNRSGNSSDWQDFVSVFGITLANFIMVIPYILAFFAVFKVSGSDDVELSGGLNLLKGVAVSLGFFVGSAAWWSMLACVINLFRAKFRPRHMLTINHVAGVIIGSLGVYTILATFLKEFIDAHNLIP